MKKNTKSNNKKNPLFFYMSLIIFSGFIIELILIYTTNYIVLNFYNFKNNSITLNKNITFFIIISIVNLLLGFGISLYIGKIFAKPIEEVKNATSEISKGNFNVKINHTKNKTIDELIDNFNNMAKELKSVETLKTDFISNVSHEIKTPISVIQSYSKELRRSDLSESKKRHYEEIIDTNVRKLNNLTNNILNLSKLENQQIITNKRNFLLDEQIRQCILSLEPEWSRKNIEFNLILPNTYLFNAEELLVQVWQNLIGNAIKFSKENDVITIEIINDDNFVTVNISDNGIGMSQEVIEHIFEKFYQGDKSHSITGNGLGLTIVKNILNLCNGTISCTSEENKGTIFSVTFAK